ncbi:16541_t:CDS:2 [Funneliformis geosporum]|uniref:9169_t:CDS:1 n=1 Tax=Funneliformis geosporum TaxID=1117311 RepID=A0A9W4T1X0_9GLOM|nr:16541_t:CDS:2 [Funneliformis geosporum]CAI2188760.1 9169_t:CDS:2 [Funneliformis geosporum]
MRLGDFSLEILIENKVLPEYEIPKDDNTKLVSYSRESINKREFLNIESKNVTYVAVPESNCHFAIRVGIHSTKDPNLFKGEHVVDGKNDNTHMEIDPKNEPYTYMYGFYNHNKSVFHLFKFDSANWKDDNVFVSNIPRITPSKITKNKGQLGAISVYIYKAKKMPEKRTNWKTNNNNQERLTTCGEDLDFDPADIIFTPKQDEPFINLKTLHPHPVAKLHIHYQTKQWLNNHYKSKGLNIPNILNEANQQQIYRN